LQGISDQEFDEDNDCSDNNNNNYYLCKFIRSDVSFGGYDAHCIYYDRDIKNDFTKDSLNILNYVKITKGEKSVPIKKLFGMQ